MTPSDREAVCDPWSSNDFVHCNPVKYDHCHFGHSEHACEVYVTCCWHLCKWGDLKKLWLLGEDGHGNTMAVQRVSWNVAYERDPRLCNLAKLTKICHFFIFRTCFFIHWVIIYSLFFRKITACHGWKCWLCHVFSQIFSILCTKFKILKLFDTKKCTFLIILTEYKVLQQVTFLRHVWFATSVVFTLCPGARSTIKQW